MQWQRGCKSVGALMVSQGWNSGCYPTYRWCGSYTKSEDHNGLENLADKDPTKHVNLCHHAWIDTTKGQSPTRVDLAWRRKSSGVVKNLDSITPWRVSSDSKGNKQSKVIAMNSPKDVQSTLSRTHIISSNKYRLEANGDGAQRRFQKGEGLCLRTHKVLL